MDIKKAQTMLNEKVKYGNSTYFLTACILRKDEKTNKRYFQAELHELHANCVVIVRLDKVEECEVNCNETR